MIEPSELEVLARPEDWVRRSFVYSLRMPLLWPADYNTIDFKEEHRVEDTAGGRELHATFVARPPGWPSPLTTRLRAGLPADLDASTLRVSKHGVRASHRLAEDWFVAKVEGSRAAKRGDVEALRRQAAAATRLLVSGTRVGALAEALGVPVDVAERVATAEARASGELEGEFWAGALDFAHDAGGEVLDEVLRALPATRVAQKVSDGLGRTPRAAPPAPDFPEGWEEVERTLGGVPIYVRTSVMDVLRGAGIEPVVHMIDQQWLYDP